MSSMYTGTTSAIACNRESSYSYSSSPVKLSAQFLRDRSSKLNETSKDCYPSWVEVLPNKKKFKMATVAMETDYVWKT